MKSLCVCLLFALSLEFANLQNAGSGSGAHGNLRLCIVEGRGSYKRGPKYCPILDKEPSGVECVLGTDRLDCLRRISKGTVDFGVFSPEDLIAAQWANIDVLVTNELRDRERPFERSVVAVVNRRIIPDTTSSVHAVLKNTTLCDPGDGIDNLRPLSDTMSGYLESLVIPRSCEPTLSLSENRVLAEAKFFAKACKAGAWVPDPVRDAELKLRYPSLCAACASPSCSNTDPYRGDSGARACLVDGAGDVLWAVKDDIAAYFGLNGREAKASPDPFAYLCRDGSFQPLTNNSDPCVWLERPWPVVVAKRKAAEAVSQLVSSITSAWVAAAGWRGALAALLQLRRAAAALAPRRPLDQLAAAAGFREAYSQTGCHPPRYITLCTTSLIEKNKCEWLSEAGAVYGIMPPLQCALQSSIENCLAAVRNGSSDVTVASDHLIPGIRDYDLQAILYEVTPIVEKMNTVVAYVRRDAMISNMAQLRGKIAAFPRYDGTAWHSVMQYIKTKYNTCHYFSEICAGNSTIDKVKSCGNGVDAELLALKSVVEGKSHVAFVSINTFNMYKAHKINEAWAQSSIDLVPVCPEENSKYCFISWSNIGHIFAAKTLTDMRRHEIINVFTKLDQLFGKKQPMQFRSAMFSMYGPFNHKLDVLFHNNTKGLATIDMLNMDPYSKIPLNFERSVVGATFDSCHLSEIVNGSGVTVKATSMVLLAYLVVVFLSY